MRLFIAGADQQIKIIKKLRPPNVLLSYYYLSREGEGLEISLKEWVVNKVRYRPKIFLDSGAFTAFTQKKTINIRRYINYIKRNKKYIFVYCGLDVIGNAQETLKNQEEMERDGLKPIYTYHVGEDIKYLKEAIEKYDFIALGGMVPYAKDENFLRKWLNECFSLINVPKTKIKVHGFGMTNFDLIKEFPFYSVDSTSWLAGSRFQQFFIWDEKEFKMKVIKKDEFEQYKEYITSFKIDYYRFLKKLPADDINLLSLKAFLDAEKSINEYYNQKGWNYWQEQEQQADFQKRYLNPEFVAYKGKIQEILKDPKIKEKQQINLMKRLKGNLFSFKTGQYAKILPLYCNDCYAKEKCPYYKAPKDENEKIMCALRREFKSFFPECFDIRNEEKVKELQNRIISILTDRFIKQVWFEILDGGITDKAATNLGFGILDRLKEASPQIQFNINQTEVPDTIVLDLTQQIEQNKDKEQLPEGKPLLKKPQLEKEDLPKKIERSENKQDNA